MKKPKTKRLPKTRRHGPLLSEEAALQLWMRLNSDSKIISRPLSNKERALYALLTAHFIHLAAITEVIETDAAGENPPCKSRAQRIREIKAQQRAYEKIPHHVTHV
jgi:hypothetical protein